MQANPDISIIGPGKVGTAIGVQAARAGWRVAAVGGGRPGRAEAAAEAIGRGARACSPPEAAGLGGLVLLTVPDGAIAGVCDELAAAEAFGGEAVVAHCCGAIGSGVLQSARERCGCSIGSMHPLQTFATVEAAMDRLAGTWCFCEGDDRAVGVLGRLAEAVGARPARIRAEDKALYHAAAVTACNYVVTLLDAAAAMAESAGISRADWLAAAGPIVRATIDNVSRVGPEQALTGPVARGDAETVGRHVEALRGAGAGLRELYATVGQGTVQLALRKGTIDPRQAGVLSEILNGLFGRE